MVAAMDTDDRILRLEQAVIYLQEIALHADTGFKGKVDKDAISALSDLTAQISSEHGHGA
jgi:hypothetical protein